MIALSNLINAAVRFALVGMLMLFHSGTAIKCYQFIDGVGAFLPSNLVECLANVTHCYFSHDAVGKPQAGCFEDQCMPSHINGCFTCEVDGCNFFLSQLPAYQMPKESNLAVTAKPLKKSSNLNSTNIIIISGVALLCLAVIGLVAFLKHRNMKGRK